MVLFLSFLHSVSKFVVDYQCQVATGTISVPPSRVGRCAHVRGNKSLPLRLPVFRSLASPQCERAPERLLKAGVRLIKQRAMNTISVFLAEQQRPELASQIGFTQLQRSVDSDSDSATQKYDNASVFLRPSPPPYSTGLVHS